MGLLDVFRRRKERTPQEVPVQRAPVRDEVVWRPAEALIRYEGSNFKMVEGLDDIKYVIAQSMECQHATRVTGKDQRIHVLLAGPPGVSKSLLLQEAENEIPLDRRVFVLGSQVSKAGLRDMLLSNPNIDFVLIDELDKMGKQDYDVLLSLMQSGRIAVLKRGLQKDVTVMATVLATANYLEMIPLELLDRFLLLYLKSYGLQDFMRVAMRILMEKGELEEKQAREIAERLWSYGYRSIRDVVRVANLAQGSVERANAMLKIMIARTPPTDMVRAKGWRPKR